MILNIGRKMQVPGSLDISGVFLSKESNEALLQLSKDPGNLREVKLDGTNLEPNESEKIVKLIEKSILQINSKDPKLLDVQESMIMSSRFSCVWNSVKKQIHPRSRYLIHYSTHHLYAEYPRVKIGCVCGRIMDISEMYICNDCEEVRCDLCAESSLNLNFCYKCSKVNQSNVSLVNPRECTNCNECPKCETLLRIDQGKVDRAGEFFYYSCSFCKWNSIYCEISARKSNEVFSQSQDAISKVFRGLYVKCVCSF